MAITFNGDGVSGVEFNGAGVNRVTFNEVEVFAAARPTELVFRLTANDLTQTIYFVQSAANAVSVDWGDNSAPSGSADLTAEVSHTYAAAGEYTVRIYCEDGETWSPGAEISETRYSVCRNITNPDTRVNNVLIRASVQNVIDLRKWAFMGCAAMQHIDIGESVETIGQAAFSGDEALLDVVIPPSVVLVGNGLFTNCTGLYSITFLPITPPTFSGTATSNVFGSNCALVPIYVLASSVAAYQAASGWSARAEYIQAIE